MSLIPQIPNPYLEAISVGLLYGLVYCTPTCLPYIASYIAGVGADFRKGTVVTLVFNFGRVVSYALIGGFVGILSGVFRFVVTESSLSAFQQYSSLVFGVITILIGVAVYLKSRSAKHDCPAAGSPNEAPRKGLRARLDVGAFSLGLSRGLILCPPLVILLLYSIPFGTPIDGFLLAVLFGVGTAVSPMLLLGGVSGWLLNKAPLFRKWIALAGASMLIILGIAALANPLFS
jgi:thiol:disulfide interchange protein DsbD